MYLGKPLEPKYRDHQLSGNMSDFRECHIEPDWLLIYRVEDDRLIIIATETGTHANLFGMQFYKYCKSLCYSTTNLYWAKSDKL